MVSLRAGRSLRCSHRAWDSSSVSSWIASLPSRSAKSPGKIPVDSPGLAAVIADMLYPQADLFHTSRRTVSSAVSPILTKTGY